MSLASAMTPIVASRPPTRSTKRRSEACAILSIQ
jgi:hypothetical protein